MTAVDTTTRLDDQQLGLMFQYTIEAYKTFQKLAESLPNPLAAQMFKQFAQDERELRDLIEMKVQSAGATRVRVTLGADLLFQEMLEGGLSYRAQAEFLIARERTMERKLTDLAKSASINDRPLLVYLASCKRAHVVELERELELIKLDPDWLKREDAQFRIVHGPRNE